MLEKSSSRLSEATSNIIAQNSVLLAVGLFAVFLVMLLAIVFDLRLPKSLASIRQAYSIFPKEAMMHNPKIVAEYCADDD